jgi:hypothetical protein
MVPSIVLLLYSTPFKGYFTSIKFSDTSVTSPYLLSMKACKDSINVVGSVKVSLTKHILSPTSINSLKF